MAKFFVYPFAIDGDVSTIPNPTQVSGTVSYQNGFTINYQLNPLTDPSGYYVPRLQFNQLMLDTTGAIRQYQTEGVPDFITTADNLGTPFSYDIYARVRYNDGTGFKIYENQVQGNITLPTDPSWIVISGPSIAPGIIQDFGGLTAPAGYLLCDGAAYSRTTYAVLFSAIGTIWGAGDGSTTFNVPDMRRRSSMGSGGTGTVVIGNTTGNTGGTETNTITIDQLPSPMGYVHGANGTGGGLLGPPPYGSVVGWQGGPSGAGPNTIPVDTNGIPQVASNIIAPRAVVTRIIKF